MTNETAMKLAKLRRDLREWIADAIAPQLIRAQLIRDHMAVFRFVTGTNEMRCRGVVATCTHSTDAPLFEAWLRAADRALAKHWGQ